MNFTSYEARPSLVLTWMKMKLWLDGEVQTEEAIAADREALDDGALNTTHLLHPNHLSPSFHLLPHCIFSTLTSLFTHQTPVIDTHTSKIHLPLVPELLGHDIFSEILKTYISEN